MEKQDTRKLIGWAGLSLAAVCLPGCVTGEAPDLIPSPEPVPALEEASF